MSGLQAPRTPRQDRPAHPLSLPEIGVLAAGVLFAMMVGIACSGLLPH